MPEDVKTPFVRECQLHGADVTLVAGLITDAGRLAAERGPPLGWYDVSTLKEPFRVEGKKTMGYEIAEQLGAKIGQVAVAWLMARPSITAPIVSATNMEQLQELLDSAELSLGEENINKIDLASAF